MGQAILVKVHSAIHHYVYADEQIDACIERLKDYSKDSIPVLDANNRLTGVLTAQEITRLVDVEMRDDYAKLAGLTAEEDLQGSLKKSITKRLPWLAWNWWWPAVNPTGSQGRPMYYDWVLFLREPPVVEKASIDGNLR